MLDPAVHDAIEAELGRQRGTLEMIASENVAPPAILQAQGSILTNKYSEGYPGRRYYGGCEHVDAIERLAIERARSLFHAEHANVQPHSGAQANAAALTALAEPGDTILGLELSHGGHLTHGTSMNFSGRLYDAVAYHVDQATGLLDLAEVEFLARRHRPRVIIAGCSAYPRAIDWAAFRHIADEVESALLIDMAHVTGLVAAGLHPSPVPYADIVTATTHKTLGGARGGLILARAEHAKAVDAAVFPGTQGGALNQVIAAKAVTFLLAGLPEFVDRQRRTVEGARLIAARLSQGDAALAGITVVTGGTDIHMVLLDLREAAALGGPGDGRDAEDRLHEAGITANRNAIPFDARPAMRTSGLRLGTSALAARGFDAVGFEAVAQIVLEALLPGIAAAALAALRVQVEQLAAAYPLYPAPTH